jgi:hypothetical protein
MAVTPTYDATIARVRIDATVLSTQADWALVERSTDGVRWETVRGGSEWPCDSSSFVATLDDFEFPSGVATTYRVSPYDVTNYPQDTALNGLVLDGIFVGEYATSPDAASLDIVGDLDLRAEITPWDWTPGEFKALVGKWTSSGNQRSYVLMLTTSGELALSFSTLGSDTITRTSTTTVLSAVPADGRLAVRATLDVNNGAAGHDVKFYTASSIDGSWTQLGATVTTAGVTSVFASTALAQVGGRDAGSASLFTGIIHAAQILSGIGGTVVANPDFTIQDNADSSFADTATPAKTWTVGASAAIVVPQTGAVTATLTEVWLKSIIRPYLNRAVRVVGFDQVARTANLGLFDVIGRSYPVAVTDVRGSRRYNLTIRTETRADAEEFDLILASGDPVFLHSPEVDHLWLPGELYAVIGDTTQTRLGTKDNATTDFVLPLTEVAAPAADIVGVTVSWQSIVNGYATWDDVLAAFSDWAGVLDSLGSVSDVIVP